MSATLAPAIGELPAGELPALPVPRPILARACHVRQAAERDRSALAEMFARCSPSTRYRRFHGHVNVLPQRYLTEVVSGSPQHFALVACAGTVGAGSVVALASCRTVAPGAAELGFLVEDAWQRLGIGAAMLREIGHYAGRAGLTTLTAQVLAEQGWLVRVLGAFGSCESRASRGVIDVTLQLQTRESGLTTTRVLPAADTARCMPSREDTG